MAKIGDAAVRKATGKGWQEWIRLLDAKGAEKMSHKAIVACVGKHHRSVSGWWQQMVAVTYEQERGLRDKHQKPEGYEISKSKTVAVPLGTLFSAWKQKRMRKRWLAEADFTVRKATPDKSMRITWTDGKTSVDANFYAKEPDKSQIVVQHSKLKSAAQAERMKLFWAEQLDRLKQLLES